MINASNQSALEEKLLSIIEEMSRQTSLSEFYPPDSLDFNAEMEQMREWATWAGESELAYQAIVANLDQVPFVLSGKAAIQLLEIGLIMGFKTDREEDRLFDRRASST